MAHRRFFFILIIAGALLLGAGFQSTRAQSSLPPAQEERLELLRASLGQGIPPNLLPPAEMDPSPNREQGPDGLAEIRLPGSYQIVFQIPGAESWDLYLMNGQNMEIRPFMVGNDNDFSPAFAPNGDRVFLAREVEKDNYDIHSYSVDQASFVRLTNAPGNDLYPEPSPDNTQVVFQSMRDGNSELYLINSDGSNPRRLTDHPAYDGEPTWSPDGTRIAFVSDRGGIYDLWVMDADGSNLHQLTSGAYALIPAWSPQGNQIAVSLDTNWNGWLELWLVGADSDGGLFLLENATASASSDYWKPAWTPDGKTILLVETFWNYHYLYESWVIVGSSLIQFDLRSNNILGNYGFSDYIWDVDLATPDLSAPGQCRILSDDGGKVAGDGALFRMQVEDTGSFGVLAYEVQTRPDAYHEWESLYTWQPAPGGVITGSIYASKELRCRAYDSGGNVGGWSETPYTRLEYDAAPPESVIHLEGIDLTSENATLAVQAADIGVGVARVDLYARTTAADSAWELYREDLQPGAEVLFPLQAGVTYEVRSSAVDRVGNYEVWAPTPDATFSLDQPPQIPAPRTSAVSADNGMFLPLIAQAHDPLTFTPRLNEWPTYAQNNARTSYNSLEPGATNYVKIWSQTATDCAAFSPPTVSAGVFSYSLAVCDTATPRLIARDSRNGDLLWRQEGAPDNNSGVFMDSTLKYGRVFQHYRGYNADRLMATQLRSGNVIWENSLLGEFTGIYYAPLVFQDSLYSFPATSFLAAYDAASGVQKWRSRVAVAEHTTPALSFDPLDGTPRLVNFLQNFQQITHLKSGFLDWELIKLNYQYAMHASPVIAGDIALYQYENALVAVDLTTRQILWTKEYANMYSDGNQPAVDGGEIYTILDNKLQVLDLSDGSLLWDFEDIEVLQYTPVLTRNQVFVQSPSQIFILNRQTHEVVQHLAGAGSFVVADGHLYRLREINQSSAVVVEIYRAENE